MPSVIEISSWDLIESTAGDVVITTPPIPRPLMVIGALDAIYVVTDGLPVRLVGSGPVIDVIMRSRTVVVAEAHEHIARETLVRMVAVKQHLDGEPNDDRQAA